jgi:hypothetical protein
MSAQAEFEAHLDACEQCRTQPFNLCPIGAPILQRAATEAANTRSPRNATCVHQFTASAAGAPPSEYMPRLEDSVCAKCGVPFQSSTRTDDRRENDRHPARPL